MWKEKKVMLICAPNSTKLPYNFLLIGTTSFPFNITGKIGNVNRGALRKAGWGSCFLCSKCFFAYNVVDIKQNGLKCFLHIKCFQRRGLKEREAFFFGQDLGVFCGDCSQVIEIRLVSGHHDDDVGVCVVPQLPKPPCDVVKCLSFGNVINQKCPYSSSVISTCDCSIPFLASRIPYLCLHRLPFYLNRIIYTSFIIISNIKNLLLPII